MTKPKIINILDDGSTIRTCKANIFDGMNSTTPPDAVVIPINLSIRKDGTNVMAVGIGKEIKKYVPNAEALLGARLKEDGNRVVHFANVEINGKTIKVIGFPTKALATKIINLDIVMDFVKENFSVGDFAPSWAQKVNLETLEKSLTQLKMFATKHNITNIYMPRVGAGYGELSYEDTVKDLLEGYLDKRFVVFDFETPYVPPADRPAKKTEEPEQPKPANEVHDFDDDIPF